MRQQFFHSPIGAPMKATVTPDEVIHAVNQAASEKGRETTKDGRRVLRSEIARELQRIAATAQGEEDSTKPEQLMEKARTFLDFAEKRGIFTAKTRIGYVVVRTTIEQLRAEHARTGECQVWPFC